MLYIKSKGVWGIFAKRAILCDKDWFFKKNKDRTYPFSKVLIGDKKILQNFHCMKINHNQGRRQSVAQSTVFLFITFEKNKF
jgi:hypothetical protein